MKSHILFILFVLVISISSAQSEGKKNIKSQVNVTNNIKIGEVKPQEKDPRIHTEKEIREHKDSMAGKSTVGVTIEF